jgi:U4/U6.U5 tri-snRNP-associated protein 1
VLTATTEFSHLLEMRVMDRAAELLRGQTPRGDASDTGASGGLQPDEDEDEDEDEEEDEDEAGSERKDVATEALSLTAEPQARGSMAAALELMRRNGALQQKEQYAGRASDVRPTWDTSDPSDPASRVKLEYRDEFGRKMTPKEAFRFMCYKFHGRGPGRKRLEKRIRDYLRQLEDSKRGTTEYLEALVEARRAGVVPGAGAAAKGGGAGRGRGRGRGQARHVEDEN